MVNAAACALALASSPTACSSDETTQSSTSTSGTGGDGGGSSGAGGVSGGGGAGASAGAGGGGGTGGGGPGCVVYVDGDSGSDGATGLSWSSAKATVNAALDVAETTGCPVWVAAGEYHPSAGTDRTASITLRANIALYGGFAGTETSLDDRNINANETVLSGDLGTAGDHSDNSYHVVVGAEGARLDGFTVTAGFADGPGADEDDGAGLLSSTDLTVANCRFEDNGTGDGAVNEVGTIGGDGGYGAAIYHGGGTLTVEATVLDANWTGDGGNGNSIGGNGGFGAGIYVAADSVSVLDSMLSNNVTGDGANSTHSAGGIGGSGGPGAGIYVAGGASLVVTSSTLTGNVTGSGGATLATNGGIGGLGGWGAGVGAQTTGSITVEDCTIAHNTTGDGGSAMTGAIGGEGGPGAGIASYGDTALVITGTIFGDNLTGNGGATSTNGGWGGNGSGLFATLGAGDLVVAGCTFTANQTGQGGPGANNGYPGFGGGAHVIIPGSGSVWLVSSTFVGNGAHTGAGLRLTMGSGSSSTGDTVIVNTVFTGNSAVESGGGLSYLANGRGELLATHCTFSGNTAGFTGGAIHYLSREQAGNASPRLVNSILWNDSATTGAEIGSHDIVNVTEVLLEVDGNDIQGGCDSSPSSLLTCGTNLDVDPVFTNPGNGVYTLQSGSPVTNQGDGTELPADVADLDGDSDTQEATPLDRAGNPRVVGADVDLGAYEIQ
ncbi:MAG: hypothetical protein JRI68_16845 [Deltaproteobacteria bacterium]|nr:hypothetical protein [Deltaproteobacteria bacterium]